MSAGGGGSVTPEPSDGPTSSACLEELLARGVAAVRQAAAFALDPGEELRIEAKAHRNDLVTQVDRGVEERIAGHLEATGVPIHGEEAHRVEDFETYRGRGAWVQPLLAASAGADDAVPRALERVEDLPLSEGMLIAHYQLTQDAGIGRAIEASRGMRCYGAAALEMAEVAAGGAVVYAQPRLQPWDVAAGALLCTETGAVLTRMDGAPFDVRRAGSLLVGTPTAHAEVLGHLRAVGA